MITKLRRKFIAVNMLLAVLVLVTTFGVVVYLDYVSSYNNAYRQLDSAISEVTQPKIAQIESVQRLTMDSPAVISLDDVARTGNEADGDSSASSRAERASENASTTTREGITASREMLDTHASAESSAEDYPTIGTEAVGGSEGGRPSDAAANEAADDDDVVTAPSIGTGTTSSGILLVAVYEVQDNGIYTAIPASSTASISESVLLRANDLAMESPEEHGDLEEFGLLFAKAPYEGRFIVAYGDDASTTTWRGLAWTLCGVGLVALVVFFLINIYFSRWALRPVRESIEQQQQFTADASHELKTPLTVILANMAILRSSANETVGSQIQWVDSTQKEAERMQLLVSDMLDLAKLKTVPESVEDKVKFDFSDLVEGEVLQFESVAFERGITMDSTIDAALYVFGNPERFGRMVSTLIDNACKYVNDGGVIDVRLTSQRGGGIKAPSAVLTIRNTGPVISDEDLPHLFNRFYRADKARTGSKGGYGLGLAIAKEIALDANGDITVQSSEEDGTAFTVTIPLSV